MIRIVFVRHAESDTSIKEEPLRPLTLRGEAAAIELVRVFEGYPLDGAYCSPFKRSIDTIRPLVENRGIPICIWEDLREREVGEWVEDFALFAKKQWRDFDFKLSQGESLREVQIRYLGFIHHITKSHINQRILVGTHGTALCALINAYDPEIGFDFFWSIRSKMPFVVEMGINAHGQVKWEELFSEELTRLSL